MNKFKTAWDDYNKSSYKKKVLMDQVSILSVKEINDGSSIYMRSRPCS